MKQLDLVSRRRRRNDAGFTLPELLITIVILGVIMFALSEAFIAVLKSNQTTTDRLGQSHDAQLVANYLVQDAQSADGTGVSTTALCGQSGSSALSLRWTSVDSSFTSTTKEVSYILSGQTLTRWACSGSSGSSGPWSNVTSQTVSHYVLSVGAPSCVNATASTTCAAGSTALKMDFSELQGQANAYTYHLNAAFRKSNGKPTAGFPGISNLPLIVLGSGPGTCVTMSGKGIVTVPTAGGVAANCSGNYNGNGTIIAGGSTATVNTTTNCSTASCPPGWTGPTPPIADPYASLALPTVSGTPVPVTCSKGGTLSPGIYTDVTLKGDCTLATGSYEITGSLIGLSGNNLTSAPGGVRVYFTSASASIDPGQQGSVSLMPMLDSSPWGKASVIMPASTASMSFAGKGNVTAGVFYAPKASLTLKGQGADTFIQLVLATVTATGQGDYSVGCTTSAGEPTSC